MRYAVHESNMDRLEKKLQAISNKCKKYGCEFHYERVGEEFRTVKDEAGKEIITRFVLVEADGVAKLNGWRFIATLEHTENGNIIHRYDKSVEVPDRYYSCKPVCEHCNTNRSRKDTFIVMNEDGEFKQVGRGCLKSFTNGLSAEAVARYMSFFDSLIEAEVPYGGCGCYERYFDVEEMACYFAETIRHFGFVRSQDYGRSTSSRAFDYYAVNHGLEREEKVRRALIEEMAAVGFDHESEAAKKETAEAMAWVETREDNDNYMHNLKVLCSTKYTTHRNFGLLASLFPTFRRELEHEAEHREKERREAEKASRSEFVGEVGKRITIEAKSGRCVSSWEGTYGYTFLYEFIDESGNVFMWFASRSIETDKLPGKVVGTIKDHKEYHGIKQTILTRCRIA